MNEMERMRWGSMAALGVCLSACVLAACPQPDPIPTNNLDRPSAIAFVCLDQDGNPIAPTDCDPPRLEGTSIDPRSGDDLFVLLVNSERGELAVVRDRFPLSGTGIGSSSRLRVELIDSDDSVPGFSFIQVGRFPVALETTPDGAFVYAVNGASCSLSRLDAHDVANSDHRGPLPAIPLPGRPGDGVVLADNGEGILAVTLPESGQIAVVEPELFSASPEMTESCATPATAADAHILALLEIPVVGTAPASRPNRLAYHEASERLFVTDEASTAYSVVDVSDPSAPVLLESVDVDFPTGAIGVSPDGSVGYMARLDRNLLLSVDLDAGELVEVVDDPLTDEVGIDLGGTARDVVFFANASGLAADEVGPDNTGPTSLFGTFAAVATTNGSVYFINVDPEFPERDVGAEASGELGILRSDQSPGTVRNVLSDDHASVSTVPRVFLGEDEVLFDPGAPDPLVPVVATDPGACMASLTWEACFSDDDHTPENDYGVNLAANATGNENLADITRVRTTPTETWAFIWEGEIVGTERYAGLLVGAGRIEDPLASFCDRGVLAGDLLEILDPPRPDCPGMEREFFSAPENRFFPINDATTGALVVGTSGEHRLTPECFGDFVAYRVRVKDAFVAVGTVSRFLHNVTADLMGACVAGAEPDPGRVPTMNARPTDVTPCARIGVASLPFLELVLWYDSCDSDGPGDIRRDTRISFGVESGFSPLVLNPIPNGGSGINTSSNLAAVARSPLADLCESTTSSEDASECTELYVVDEGSERITIWFVGASVGLIGDRLIE